MKAWHACGHGATLGLVGVFLLSFLAGCASLPPGSEYRKTTSIALSRPEQTRMGQHLAEAKAEHAGLSGFKLLPVGIDSFLLRMELADAASRTLADAGRLNYRMHNKLFVVDNEIGIVGGRNAFWQRTQADLFSWLPLDELL